MIETEGKPVRLEPGDFFHAESPGGTPLICLVLSVSDTTIRARHVTSGHTLYYERASGRQVPFDDGLDCPYKDVGSVIRSIEPLPIEIHNTLLAMDRRYRLGTGDGRARLTPDERKMVLFLELHYGYAPGDDAASNLLRIWEIPK